MINAIIKQHERKSYTTQKQQIHEILKDKFCDQCDYQSTLSETLARQKKSFMARYRTNIVTNEITRLVAQETLQSTRNKFMKQLGTIFVINAITKALYP